MADVFKGRMTADLGGDFAVFIIGMRLNKIWKVRSWLPVVRAANTIMGELGENKDLGMLGSHTWFRWREIVLIQ